LKTIIREAAFADLENICNWIARENSSAARSVAQRVLDAIENKIAHFPHVGRRGRKAGTREWIVRGLPYIIVYRVEADAVIVLGVFHGARDR
jgi:toxin ParE1/3/4